MRGLFFSGCGVYRYSIASSFIHGVRLACADQSGSSYVRKSRSVGISSSHTFFDRVNLALRHCEGTANAAPWALTPAAWGIRFSQLHFGLRKKNKPATEEYGCERCTQRLLQPFPNLFPSTHVLDMNVMTSFHPSLFAYLCQCVCNRP